MSPGSVAVLAAEFWSGFPQCCCSRRSRRSSGMRRATAFAWQPCSTAPSTASQVPRAVSFCSRPAGTGSTDSRSWRPARSPGSPTTPSTAGSPRSRWRCTNDAPSAACFANTCCGSHRTTRSTAFSPPVWYSPRAPSGSSESSSSLCRPPQCSRNWPVPPRYRGPVEEMRLKTRRSRPCSARTAACSRRSRAATCNSIRGLAQAIDAKDPYTAGHTSRVAQYSVRIAGALGLDDATRREIEHGALLHDIGKIGVPDAVLTKPGPLDDGRVGRHAPPPARRMRHPRWRRSLADT